MRQSGTGSEGFYSIPRRGAHGGGGVEQHPEAASEGTDVAPGWILPSRLPSPHALNPKP